ncbi:MAG: amino acid transporter [Silicimonas sp.]|nr:amino acid transporter [Silicimonas sp.]
MTAFIPGFALSLSLILAIGAQNAFVLRQGIRGLHVGAVVLTCILSEAVLIGAGVAGFGALTHAYPAIGDIARWGGAAFLLAYGALSLRRALIETESLDTTGTAHQSRTSAVLTCLAITWLNPHVYLDTVVLIGAVATQYGPDRWWFGAGALTASALFFILLGYGAAFLQPVFARATAWRVLDIGVALLMWAIAALLIAT